MAINLHKDVHVSSQTKLEMKHGRLCSLITINIFSYLTI